jgi:3-dehydroquinate dehydratase-2
MPDPGAATASLVLVLNGPNLSRLGTREPEIYGTATLADVARACAAAGDQLGFTVDVRQTEDEAELIGWASYELALRAVAGLIAARAR